jgi:hypothetical protein
LVFHHIFRIQISEGEHIQVFKCVTSKTKTSTSITRFLRDNFSVSLYSALSWLRTSLVAGAVNMKKYLFFLKFKTRNVYFQMLSANTLRHHAFRKFSGTWEDFRKDSTIKYPQVWRSDGIFNESLVFSPVTYTWSLSSTPLMSTLKGAGKGECRWNERNSSNLDKNSFWRRLVFSEISFFGHTNFLLQIFQESFYRKENGSSFALQHVYYSLNVI